MSKSENTAIDRHKTGIPNLDAILDGGLPKRSVTVIAGPPGSGKTILSHQVGFHNADDRTKVVFFQTLGEPTSKRLAYLHQFSYFDREKFETSVRFIDLGSLIRMRGIESVIDLIMDHIKREKPQIVVIDSFKAFGDLVGSMEQYRKFSYEIIIKLIAWECTTLLLGEFSEDDFQNNPLFSVIDGIIVMNQVEISGEQLRMLRVFKMRGTSHNRDRHPFLISGGGIQLFAPRVVIRRESVFSQDTPPDLAYCLTGIPGFDELMGSGVTRGSSILVSGASGTGKTILLLQFIYLGATLYGEKGILFSFEETHTSIYHAAQGLGWDLSALVEQGMIEIICIPQPDVLVEEHLLLLQKKIEANDARRVAVDTLSSFLHKIEHDQLAREKVFQLVTIIQNWNAIAFLSTEIPFGTSGISRYGIEESAVDGIVVLTLASEDSITGRSFEIYKMKRTAHSLGRHPMRIERGGMRIMAPAKKPGDKSNGKGKKVGKKAKAR